ncbi:hypothetical protein ACLKA7_008684 [Drosophila subpalustris]
MRVSNSLSFCSLLLLVLLTGFCHAKPLEELSNSESEPSEAPKNKTAVTAGEEEQSLPFAHSPAAFR